MAAYKIGAGLRSDYETLLRRFQRTRCVRFEEFSKIWREMKFTLVFCGHENESELLAFTDECLAVALNFCLPPHSFQWRVGGLYIIYAIYFRQPNKPLKSKIRVTLNQWRLLLTFIAEVIEQNHHDTHFVFLKLRQHDAFHFVATPKQMTVIQRVRNDRVTSRCFLESSALKDMLEDEYANSWPMEQVHERYLSAKMELFPQDTSVSIINEDLITSVVGKIEEFEKMRLKVVDGYLNESEVVMEKRDKDNENNNVDEDDDDDGEKGKSAVSIGTRRIQLKKQSMSQLAETLRSRRHRAVELAESTITSPSKKGRKTGKTARGEKQHKLQQPQANEATILSEHGMKGNQASPSSECQLSMPSFSGTEEG